MTPASCRVQLFSRAPGDPVRWRLLSTNNREIGRGVDYFADAETCRVAVKEVQASIDELQLVVRRADSHTWVWQLLRDNDAVAASSHPYDRQIRCGRGLRHFLDEIRTASVIDEVMTSHARRWRGSVA